MKVSGLFTYTPTRRRHNERGESRAHYEKFRVHCVASKWVYMYTNHELKIFNPFNKELSSLNCKTRYMT